MNNRNNKSEKAIKDIFISEYNSLLETIENDYSKNYSRKANNIFVNQSNRQLTAYLVFVSSFESKSGNALERCARKIAMLVYGNDNVPTLVNPRNINHSFNEENHNKQFVVTDVDIDNAEMASEVERFIGERKANGKGSKRKESEVTHESCKEVLLPLSDKYKKKELQLKPVDLAFFDGENWNIFELKAGGNLDNSNARANAKKLMTIYVAMGIKNCQPYFATLYNKDGEGNTWTGSMKSFINYPSMFLIGSDFWKKILPAEIPFNRFVDLYVEALQDINFEGRVNTLIEKATND